tara:strand:- start:41 stop:922 length:882 start_codon:yes stop_codon:yes gene_type:complete
MDEFALFQSEIEELETKKTTAKEDDDVDGEEKKKKMRVEVPIQFQKKTQSTHTTNNNNNNKPVVFASAPTKAAIKTDAAFGPQEKKKEENDDDDDDDTFGPSITRVPSSSTRPPPQGSGPHHTIKTVGQPVSRRVAGEKWVDNTLGEWPANDYRIFVGDLGPECTDEQLAKAFAGYSSFAKARVVRDKKTMKSRGYGFVSMLESLDFAKAMKEVHGKWIGSRPCKLRKSSWEERNDTNAGNKRKGYGGGVKNLGGLGEYAGGGKKRKSGYGLKHNRKHLAIAPSIEKYKANNK